MTQSFLIDSHCHLDMASYQDDLDQVLLQATEAGVRFIISIGIDLASSQRAIALAERHAQVFATVGVHPHDAESASPETLTQLCHLCSHPKVVGWGEIGLDYAKQYAPKARQQQAFEHQMRCAIEAGLPVVIHDREAHEDTMAILRQAGPLPAGGVMHCFSGDLALAEQAIDLGLMISIPGIVTFRNADTLRAVVEQVTLDHLMIETDGPFLAPVPYRGKRNTPAFLVHTAQTVADIKQVSYNTVAEQTSTNTVRLFGLPNKAT
jgi:TatD DNase family protein